MQRMRRTSPITPLVATAFMMRSVEKRKKFSPMRSTIPALRAWATMSSACPSVLEIEVSTS